MQVGTMFVKLFLLVYETKSNIYQCHCHSPKLDPFPWTQGLMQLAHFLQVHQKLSVDQQEIKRLIKVD